MIKVRVDDYDKMISTKLIFTSRVRRQRIWVILWLLWAVALLIVYYKRLWSIFVLGPLAWAEDNPSLAFFSESWEVISEGPSVWDLLPASDEAFARAFWGFFGAGAVLLTAQIIGALICWLLRWQPEDWREGLLYRTALGLGAISYLSLGLAVIGLYHPVTVQALVVAALLSAGLWILYMGIRSRLGKEPAELLPPPSNSTVGRRAGDKIWRVVALLGISFAMIGALAPEIGYDALWYHLWLPKLWLDQGRPVDVVAEFITLYPLTWELIFGAGLVLGGTVAAKLLHFACLPLTGLLVYQLTHRFMPRSSPWLAVAFFVTIPTVLWEATTANVDLALAMHVGLVIYALLRYVEGRSRQWFALAVINLGLAMASKHLGLFVLAIATGGLTLRLWFENRNLLCILKPVILLALLSLLFPLPWYIRNWLASGNPVFPDFYAVFGAFPPERWSEFSERGWRHFEAQFGRPRTMFNQLTLLYDVTVHAVRYDGSFGPLFLLLVPMLALLRRRSRIVPWLVTFILVYIGLWASSLNGLELRFLMPITPLLAVLAAETSDRLILILRSTLFGWSAKVFQVSLAILLFLNLPPFTSLHESDRELWDGWLVSVIHKVPIAVVVGQETQEEYLTRTVPSYGAWRYINSHLPVDARVLTFRGGDHLYAERERLLSNSTMAHPAVWGAPRGHEKQAFQTLLNLGVSHLLFDKYELASLKPGDLAIAQFAKLALWYESEYEDNRFILYRLKWEKIISELINPSAYNSLVTREIRYWMPEGGEVFLVWGINGWAVVSEETRPAGTTIKDNVMYTPMSREDHTFVTRVKVPSDSIIDYGFLITKDSTGAETHVWEAIRDQDYYDVITGRNGVIDIQSKVTLVQNSVSDFTVVDHQLVTQEIRYRMPEGEKVFLVWGIDGWNLLPQELQPTGTVVKDSLMHTPMVRDEDTFIAKVRVPSNTKINYGFLVTLKRNGTPINPIWDGDKYSTIATGDGVVEMQSKLVYSQPLNEFGTIDFMLNTLFGFWAMIGICVGVIVVFKNWFIKTPDEKSNADFPVSSV